jgi:hypothetical protein
LADAVKLQAPTSVPPDCVRLQGLALTENVSIGAAALVVVDELLLELDVEVELLDVERMVLVLVEAGTLVVVVANTVVVGGVVVVGTTDAVVVTGSGATESSLHAPAATVSTSGTISVNRRRVARWRENARTGAAWEERPEGITAPMQGRHVIPSLPSQQTRTR